MGLGNCMPPLGPNDGEKIEFRDGEDSVCRKGCRLSGVGGISEMLLENDLSKPGVRIVRFAGFRRELRGGMCTGDGGADKWCCEVVSTTDAVAIGGREDCEGGGILKDKFFKFRARLPGESGRTGFGVSDDNLERLLWAVESEWLSTLRGGGMNLVYDSGMDVGDSGEELGDVSAPEGESKVEMVVVGEESVDADVIDEMLSRCLKGRGRRDVLTVTLVGTSRGLTAVACSSLSAMLGGLPPNTDIKDGNESGTDGGLV